MHPPGSFIAVDWGTSNRRVFVVGAGGVAEQCHRDDLGVLSIQPGGFGAIIAELRARFGQLPLILAGMVGSNRGWIETPYIPCPADIQTLASAVKRLGDGSIFIVPGVSQTSDPPDVMRGEELQILGAAGSGLISSDALVCHPGTHAKWVNLQEGRIETFRTVMTGEMFGLLRKHSLLGDILQDRVGPDASFLAGVRHGFAHDDLLAELFSIRARALLGKMGSAAAPAYASGLLIGSDIRIGVSFASPGDDVMLIGEPQLTELYAVALHTIGCGTHCIDGEEAFLAGAKLLAEKIL